MPSLPFCVVPTALGTIAAGHEVAGKPASHLGEFDTIGMVWLSAPGSGLHWARGDFGSAKPVDFMSVIAAAVAPSTTIRLRLGTSQAEVDGTAPYDSGALTFINPAIARDDGLYHSHLEIASVQSYRWWRIDIVHGGNFQASTLVLGQRVRAATWYSPGFGFGVEDLGDIDVGRFGVADVTDGRIFRSLEMRLGWLSEADFETKFRPLVEKLGKRTPAFWCFDPTANTYRQARTYLGWIRNKPIATHVANTADGPRFQKDFEILSMI